MTPPDAVNERVSVQFPREGYVIMQLVVETTSRLLLSQAMQRPCTFDSMCVGVFCKRRPCTELPLRRAN
jgi:hypothetical protein